MEGKIRELRDKEVIDLSDGCRRGYVWDAVFDMGTGQITALVVPGRLRLFGLLGREEDLYIPWACVKQIGDDIILIQRT